MDDARKAPLRVGVLVSGAGRGTNLQAIIDASESGRIDAVVAVVVSTNAATGALVRAREHGIPAVFVDPAAFASPEELDDALAEAMRQHGVELVCNAGYMRRLTPRFLRRFPNRIMNIHPALLPSFGGQGMYGHHVHEAVYASGVRFSGATVHFVDEEYDHGPIVLQRLVELDDDDTPETIAKKVLVEEHKAYPEAIQLFAAGSLQVEGRRVRRLPAAPSGCPQSEDGKAPMQKIRRAVVSVSKKEGVADFARELAERGVEILSTGGTARVLREAGVTVTDVSEVTGFPEMMDGRVKTLHPKIHGGILALRDNPAHMEELARHEITPIDMVVVNLYPFAETIAREGVDLAAAVEQIDIGGPCMIRAAAKNCASVTVLVDPADYPRVLAEMDAHDGATTGALRHELAAKAFAHTSAYDDMIQRYLADCPAARHDTAPAAQ